MVAPNRVKYRSLSVQVYNIKERSLLHQIFTNLNMTFTNCVEKWVLAIKVNIINLKALFDKEFYLFHPTISTSIIQRCLVQFIFVLYLYIILDQQLHKFYCQFLLFNTSGRKNQVLTILVSDVSQCNLVMHTKSYQLLEVTCFYS